MTPRIGAPRVCPGPNLPVIYPGESAHALIAPQALLHAVATGAPVVVTDWMVEPMPGLYGWFLRWRYRLVGRWLPGDRPRLAVSISAHEDREP